MNTKRDIRYFNRQIDCIIEGIEKDKQKAIKKFLENNSQFKIGGKIYDKKNHILDRCFVKNRQNGNKPSIGYVCKVLNSDGWFSEENIILWDLEVKSTDKVVISKFKVAVYELLYRVDEINNKAMLDYNKLVDWWIGEQKYSERDLVKSIGGFRSIVVSAEAKKFPLEYCGSTKPPFWIYKTRRLKNNGYFSSKIHIKADFLIDPETWKGALIYETYGFYAKPIKIN